MIKSFKDKKTENLFNGKNIKQFESFRKIAERKLLMIDCASSINDLRVPPANRLETLSGNRKRQYSIRINSQWRICFIWSNDGVYDVEIVDYH